MKTRRLRVTVGPAMLSYLIELLRHPAPSSVRELAHRTGRSSWRRDRQYGPANRLVQAGLAVWVADHQRKNARRLEPTAHGYRQAVLMGVEEES